MGKKKSSKSMNFTDDIDFYVKFRPVIFDNNYCLSKISAFNEAWKGMSIERDKNKIDVIYDGKRYPYRNCRTYKECEREYEYIITVMNEFLKATYEEENISYAEFIFDEKIKDRKAYVKNFKKFFYLT